MQDIEYLQPQQPVQFVFQPAAGFPSATAQPVQVTNLAMITIIISKTIVIIISLMILIIMIMDIT